MFGRTDIHISIATECFGEYSLSIYTFFTSFFNQWPRHDSFLIKMIKPLDNFFATFFNLHLCFPIFRNYKFVEKEGIRIKEEENKTI